MKYNFKVNLTEELYKIFLEDVLDFNQDKFNGIKEEFEEFRILYNDSPEDDSLIYSAAFNECSDHYQILLVGVKGSERTILCYYYVGDKKDDIWYRQGRNDFKKILKFKIK